MDLFNICLKTICLLLQIIDEERRKIYRLIKLWFEFNTLSFCGRLVIDRETGKPKGYGFCEYKDEETALSARRNLQGYEINGRQLRVDFAENDKGADRSRDQVIFLNYFYTISWSLSFF